MIINSIKSLITYNNKEKLDLFNIPNINNTILYNEYYNFINSVLVIYGTQKADGTIPVFWTKIKNNQTLEREPDSNSTLRELVSGESYYITVIDRAKLPVRVPRPIDSEIFLNIQNGEDDTQEPCYIDKCTNPVSILGDSHRNILLTSETGFSKNIHIPISGLLPNKNYTFSIEPIHANWPNKLSQISGSILRNSPLDKLGYLTSSIDSKFMYLYNDGIVGTGSSLPFSLIDTSKNTHPNNIFSLYSVKIFEDDILSNSDTINIVCDLCIPTPTPTPQPSLGLTPTPTRTPTNTPTPSLDNNPNFYFISDTIDNVCFYPRYVILIYGNIDQVGSILYKNSELSNPWTLAELKDYIQKPSASEIYIKNRSVTIIGGADASLITNVVSDNDLAVVGNQQICPPSPPPPTPTPSSTIRPTPTPSETPYERDRKCPRINIVNKNIILTAINSAKITANFSYIDPARLYGYEFSANSGNWPALIVPKEGTINNFAIYYEDNVKYASGEISSILFFNKNLRSYSNLDYTLSDYTNENFFNKNIYSNLTLEFGRQSQINEGYDDLSIDADVCDVISDTINIVCNGCVPKNTESADCIESVSIRINNSSTDYPVLSSSSRPSSEILVQQSCCDDNNSIYANISGLCPGNIYTYEWSSCPSINFSPSSGVFSVGGNQTKINSVFNLNNNAVVNAKLKVFNTAIGNYVEDNIIIRCNNNKCIDSIPDCGGTQPPGTPPNLGFDDYILIFIDEALYPSAPGVFGYVDSRNRPTRYWYEDMDAFMALNIDQKIDINKILIFNVRMQDCKRYLLYPTVGVAPNYEMPIPLSRIIDTPRNIPRCIVNGSELTGSWIASKFDDNFGIVPNDKRINVFVDNSPSLTWAAVSKGITEFENGIKNRNPYRRTLCITERWLRWIVNIYNNNPVCS
jgi:hypothetical protein